MGQRDQINVCWVLAIFKFSRMIWYGVVKLFTISSSIDLRLHANRDHAARHIKSTHLGFRNLENSVQTVCEVAAAAVAAEEPLAFGWCDGVPETDAGQLSRFPTGWWCRVDDGGEAYRTKSPRLQTPLAVIEKLRRRYSSSTGPSGLGTFPKLGYWETHNDQK